MSKLVLIKKRVKKISRVNMVVMGTCSTWWMSTEGEIVTPRMMSLHARQNRFVTDVISTFSSLLLTPVWDMCSHLVLFPVAGLVEIGLRSKCEKSLFFTKRKKQDEARCDATREGRCARRSAVTTVRLPFSPFGLPPPQ